MNDIEKKWKPKYGEAYFTIENAVDVVRYIYMGDDIDESCILSGDYFPTRERAEQVAKKMRLLLRLEQLHDMLCPDYEPDWNNTSKQKICLGRDHADDCWFVDIFDITEYPTGNLSGDGDGVCDAGMALWLERETVAAAV